MPAVHAGIGATGVISALRYRLVCFIFGFNNVIELQLLFVGPCCVVTELAEISYA
jgi:hypothetical protein